MAASKVLIKKYENRRLYDATNSRYVNLEEVAQLVQQGCDVQVVDSVSGEDITRVILTQIIAEGAKTPNSSFPLDILRQMVIASGRASQESAVRYMKAMLDLYQTTYRAMAPALNPFDFMQNPLAGATAPGTAPPVTEPPASGNPENAGTADGLSELKDRIAGLERAISTLAASQVQPSSPRNRSAAPRKSARRKG